MDEFTDGLGEAWADVATFLPKLLGFLVILVVGYFVAKLLSKVVDRVLERVGFDRWVERGGIGRTLARSQLDASTLLGKVVFYTLMLFVLQLAFGVFGPNPISDLIHGVIAYLPNLIVAILIVVIGAAIAAAVREIVRAALGGLSYGNAVATGAAVAILVITGFAALDQLRIAPRIVNGLYFALLAIVVGVAIVAIGGGGIQAMRGYWERALGRAETAAPEIRAEARGARERIKERAQEVRQEVEREMQPTYATTQPQPAIYVEHPAATPPAPTPPPPAGATGEQAPPLP